ncbi:MAG: phosphatidate cytidylyltransferase [Chromatiales bacterium]|nr:phosphatidate cytidylyltransferase [Chromatiales bacterium]
MSTLLQRVITAVILVAALLFVLFWLPPLAGVALFTLFLAAGGWEWAAFFGWHHAGGRALYALLVTAGVLAGFLLLPGPGALAPLLWLSLFWWGLALVAVLRFPHPIGRAAAAAGGLLALVPGGVTAVTLLDKLPAGPALLLLVLVIVWAADVGAYFAGRRWGRRKLAPQVSPGKTWEGVAGGLSAAMLVALAGGWLLAYPAGVELGGLALVLLGLAVGGISILGDLTVSMFKRNVGLKDSGRLIPGHGGVLDRVDSIMAAVPLYALVLLLAGGFGP